MKLQANEAIQGFTLIELIIYIALTSAVLVSLILWVLNLSGVRDKNYAAVEVETNRQFIASVISREIKQAGAIIAPLPGATSDFLELDRSGARPNIIFRAISGTLSREEIGQSPVAISSRQVEITNLEFKNLTSAAAARGNVTLRALVRFRNPAAGEFTSERALIVTASNHL
ncbi:MAG TPA: hypothetical protein VJL36_00130 [Candidatus Paceibacterota bacterium]